MSNLAIRNVPDEVHRAVRTRATRSGRSVEAELRYILETAVKPQGRIRLGSLLAEIGRRIWLTDDEFALFTGTRGRAPTHAVDFE
jgi:plasmid stability protein